MAIPSGLSAQIGFVAESPYGTAGTVTRFLPLVDEGIQTEIDFLESAGIIAGARVLRTQQWSRGLHRIEGDVGFELYDRNLGLLLQHAMGSVTTSGTTAPYTHTFTPGELTGLGLTTQIGRPDRGGTVRPFTYLGCKVQSWELAVQTEEIATFGLTLVGQTESTGIALATASYASDIAPMSFVNGSFTLNGSSLCVRSATITGENNLTTDRVCIGQQYIDQPLENDLREYTGEVELEFPDLVHYNRFLAGTEGALVLTIRNSASTASLIATANVRTDQATPNVSGREMLVQSFSFKCVGTNSDASALTLAYRSSDSTP